ACDQDGRPSAHIEYPEVLRAWHRALWEAGGHWSEARSLTIVLGFSEQVSKDRFAFLGGKRV
ncbi:hypothetical protein AB0K74_16290, partial [Streptomyces sp. NPDC056159]|uniref:hypothetical protein n=1 Tax=Streptomyces sp. NPDC056159 TaxID=3155537 RepID=UPI00342BCC37